MIETRKFSSSIIFAGLNRLKISSSTSTKCKPDSILMDEVGSEIFLHVMFLKSWCSGLRIGELFIANIRQQHRCSHQVFWSLQEKYLDFHGNNMLIFQSFRLGDSYQSKLSDFIKCISFLSVNIEVSIEVCSDSVHFFRKFMSSTEAELINKKISER